MAQISQIDILSRALQIIRLMARDEGATVTEISKETGIDRWTVRDMIDRIENFNPDGKGLYIEEYEDENFGGSVLLIGGLSLGAQVVLEILSRRKNICRHALVESPSAIPSAVTKALTGPMVGCSYALIKNRAFSKLQFRSLHIQKDLFEDYYRDTCRISKADMKAFLKASVSYRLKEEIKECRADVHVFAGERETGVVLKSARLIKETIPGCSLRILPHLYHGEFSLNHPGDYADISLAIVRRCRV